MDKSLSPRDAAEKLGITPDTLRRWEREGLIQCERTPGGQRRYREEDISSMLDGSPFEPSRRATPYPSTVRSLNDAPEQSRARTVAPQAAPWERRVKEEQADLEVTKIRRERAELIRAERAEREAREQAANDAERTATAREVERKRLAAFKAAQEKRLNELREYGKACAVWAPAEYQAKVVRDLLSSVNLEDYPPDLSDYFARIQVDVRVEKVLKPWRDEEARKRAKLESRRQIDSLILSGKWHAQTETRNWDRRAADRAYREVERALLDEVDADWTDDEVRDLVDDVLDEWFEE
jgi:excisionase family DNA binding protein